MPESTPMSVPVVPAARAVSTVPAAVESSGARVPGVPAAVRGTGALTRWETVRAVMRLELLIAWRRRDTAALLGLYALGALGAVVPLGPDGVLPRAGPAPDRLAPWQAQHAQRRTSFRSLKEAVLAAEDGDRILLGSGTHNGMGCAGRVVEGRIGWRGLRCCA